MNDQDKSEGPDQYPIWRLLLIGDEIWRGDQYLVREGVWMSVTHSMVGEYVQAADEVFRRNVSAELSQANA
jgi:hypothetical protein